MKYLAHTVYVIAADYPKITTGAAALGREATRADIGVEKLGCFSEGRVVPLSAAEVEILRRREEYAKQLTERQLRKAVRP